MSRIRLPDERLPDGPTRLRILRAAQGRSRAGNPVLCVHFEVAAGPHAGRRVTQSYSLLPQALWRLRRLCDAAGVSLTDGEIETANLESAVIEADLRSSTRPDGPPLVDLEYERPATTAASARS